MNVERNHINCNLRFKNHQEANIFTMNRVRPTLTVIDCGNLMEAFEMLASEAPAGATKTIRSALATA